MCLLCSTFPHPSSSARAVWEFQIPCLCFAFYAVHCCLLFLFSFSYHTHTLDDNYDHSCDKIMVSKCCQNKIDNFRIDLVKKCSKFLKEHFILTIFSNTKYDLEWHVISWKMFNEKSTENNEVTSWTFEYKLNMT